MSCGCSLSALTIPWPHLAPHGRTASLNSSKSTHHPYVSFPIQMWRKANHTVPALRRSWRTVRWQSGKGFMWRSGNFRLSKPRLSVRIYRPKILSKWSLSKMMRTVSSRVKRITPRWQRSISSSGWLKNVFLSLLHWWKSGNAWPK